MQYERKSSDLLRLRRCALSVPSALGMVGCFDEVALVLMGVESRVLGLDFFHIRSYHYWARGCRGVSAHVHLDSARL